jgi:CPA2 family monovalent cation:H+ antiporter-2
MHGTALLGTLVAAIVAAFLFGLFKRLGLSPLPGYLLAGVVVGPFTPGVVVNNDLAAELSELGVLLLLFGTGLQFHVEELLAVRRIVVPGALIKVGLVTAVGAIAAHLLGMPWGVAAIYGLCSGLASTVVALRVLDDHGRLSTPAGHTVVGWLVVEYILAVVALIAVPLFAPGKGADAIILATGLLFALGKIALLTLLVVGLGGLALGASSREFFTLAVLAWMLAVSFVAARVFGASMALGAFLAGLAVGRSGYGARAASDALPLWDAFAVLFFVGTGMLLDGKSVARSLPLVAVTFVLVLVVVPLATAIAARITGASDEAGRTLAGSFAQIGEFSFLLAAAATEAHLLPPAATPVFVATALVSITVQPFLFRALLASGLARGDAVLAAPMERHRVVIIGYGPVGRSLAGLLADAGLEPVIVERASAGVARAQKDGYVAVGGDAARKDVLERAGLVDARALILSSSEVSPAIVTLAREIAPKLLVLGRAAFLREAPTLEKAGADGVIVAEGEVAYAMAERVLRTLGASAEELARAREKVGMALKIAFSDPASRRAETNASAEISAPSPASPTDA